MQALQKKQKTWVLLLLGALLGLAAFLCLYGTAPLDPANDAWIWYGYDETDIHQHYAGWLGFRNSSWQFPLAQADALIRRWESRDMLRALALDCCATAGVEQVCDQVEQEIESQFPGCSFPFRFSPGYGDLPLELQGEILHLLDAPRKIGLCASASHILTPRKSVTAILGIARGEIQQTVRSCLSCPARESCQYRKSGGHCGIS